MDYLHPPQSHQHTLCNAQGMYHFVLFSLYRPRESFTIILFFGNGSIITRRGVIASCCLCWQGPISVATVGSLRVVEGVVLAHCRLTIALTLLQAWLVELNPLWTHNTSSSSSPFARSTFNCCLINVSWGIIANAGKKPNFVSLSLPC